MPSWPICTAPWRWTASVLRKGAASGHAPNPGYAPLWPRPGQGSQQVSPKRDSPVRPAKPSYFNIVTLLADGGLGVFLGPAGRGLAHPLEDSVMRNALA